MSRLLSDSSTLREYSRAMEAPLVSLTTPGGSAGSISTPTPKKEGLKPCRVGFVHPDLGIGGAERLVVDAAVGLQQRGHSVVMLTSHHDPSHCFEETRDGTLKVVVKGNRLVPRSIGGRFHILCAILRSILLCLWLCVYGRDFDIYIVDSLSAGVPILHWLIGSKILFYCHFPDKYLTERKSLLKKIYRWPVDRFEEWTTGLADAIVVNSRFTRGMFHQAFPNISHLPQVLYPPLNLESYDKEVDESDPAVRMLKSTKKTLLSINRFERKKNIALAINTFATLNSQQLLDTKTFQDTRLIVAGGYDARILENVEYHRELQQLADQHRLVHHTIYPRESNNIPSDAQVVFLCSFSDSQRTYLLANAHLLLYTPSNEHFGIVPIEAMYASLPVVAVNNGGPTETVVNNITGFLCEPDPQAWAQVVRKVLVGEVTKDFLGGNGRVMVRDRFSLHAFVDHLESILSDLVKQQPLPSIPSSNAGPLDVLSVRTLVASCLEGTFGLIGSAVAVDVLDWNPDTLDAILKVAVEDATMLRSALTMHSSQVQIQVKNTSSHLLALASDSRNLVS
ncbi:hypothetical protein BZG36_03112 [Bifiguratus adelaidae]|uniref:Alpha-1,3/1,6-mannosyltransferase ALG2 n=1 Tax=Bifiguratus adelaidae TaxID=1938954 RepID=A0A261Y0M7_9FUNG|nr:hypothetical protein BZG36_03112 [Bifiguratus adelaidae]